MSHTDIDIFLIRALGMEGNSLPLGLLSIQSYLKKHGYHARVWDRYVDRNIQHLRKALRGVSLVGISAMSVQSADAFYLAHSIRCWYPNIKIIFGGAHFTALPNSARKIADHVVIGEGEETIKNFLDARKKNENYDFILRQPPPENLDDIPSFSMDDLSPLIRTKDFLHIATARGCPYTCNFCLGENQRPGGIRHHSIDYVVDYIDQIVKTFGITSFNIVDDVFVLSPKRVLEFCNTVENNITEKLRFTCFTHSGHGSLGLYRRMYEVGFDKISMGVEHGNDRMLKFCGKKTTRRQVEETCKNMFDAKIHIDLTYILGNATETNETISETVDFAIHLHKRFKASSWFSFAQPLPGSQLFETATRYGTFLDRNLQSFQNVHPTYLPKGVSVDHLIKERKRGMTMANKNTMEKKNRRARLKDIARNLYKSWDPLSTKNELKRVMSITGPILPENSND